MQTLENWHLAQLTEISAFGQVIYEGRMANINTDRVIMVDLAKNLLFTNRSSYKLGEPDKTWYNSNGTKLLLNVIY